MDMRRYYDPNWRLSQEGDDWLLDGTKVPRGLMDAIPLLRMEMENESYDRIERIEIMLESLSSHLNVQ